MRHVSEAALPHYGRNETLVLLPGGSVTMLGKVSSRAVAVLSEDGGYVRASCAAMPCSLLVSLLKGSTRLSMFRGPALPAALQEPLLDTVMVLGNRKLLVAGMVESSLLHIVFRFWFLLWCVLWPS